ncbi:MAG: hypothetical protein JNJ56_08005 [Ignavibacteria bacterium]|nr:hypothetical protein [Ignavibacteria bacterium]
MNASLIINFFTALITFVMGILILTGIIFPGSRDSSIQVFGIVLLIYGVYRFVNLFSKVKQIRMQERQEILNKEREKLFRKNE